MEIQNQNPLIRFLDDQTVETIKGIKDAAIENQKTIAQVKETLLQAQIRISELLKELP